MDNNYFNIDNNKKDKDTNKKENIDNIFMENEKPKNPLKDNFGYLFSDEKMNEDYQELNKEEMMIKIKQKIKEIKEKESEIHKKFKNGYIPIDNCNQTDFLKTFYQNNQKFKNGEEEEKTTPLNNHYHEKIPTKNNNFNYSLQEEGVGYIGKCTLKLDKFLKYFMQILNVLLGAAFFIAVIFYFTGVHFGSFSHPNSNNISAVHRKYRKRPTQSLEFKGYSLLMTPERTSETYKLLNNTVADLSREYKTELFEPHLTLYAPIDMPLENLKKKLNSLSMMEPFELKMTNITTGNKYYQCVLGKVELTHDLEYIYRRVMELLELENKNGYFPHVSLIYGDFHNIMKRRILNEIMYERNYVNYLPLKFTISQIEIWKTEGETKTWKCHDIIPFSTDDSEDEIIDEKN
ncbi:LigT-like protein [Piromyces finnis]|uniref:LigT-like protein n=1 Tax=Piromyces finnis TaxID=1754191 RepID=A0A1Y1V4S6_9FUNG|nr:LigT-like protein [Piromyces finnis]|eukprot:ORX47338.1 LigT-like protein [Piromyces finnis]